MGSSGDEAVPVVRPVLPATPCSGGASVNVFVVGAADHASAWTGTQTDVALTRSPVSLFFLYGPASPAGVRSTSPPRIRKAAGSMERHRAAQRFFAQLARPDDLRRVVPQ